MCGQECEREGITVLGLTPYRNWGLQVRDWLCPTNRRWNLATLLGALQQDYPRDLTIRAAATRKFVLIEYVLLHRITDTLEDAHR